MKFRISLSLLILAVLTFGGAFLIKSQTSQSYRLTGIVQDANGKPMKKTRVEVTVNTGRPSPNTRVTTTSGDGRFAFQDLPAGTATVTIPNNGDKYVNIFSIAGSNGYAIAELSDMNPTGDVVIQAVPPTPVVEGKIKTKEGDIKLCLVSDASRCSNVIVENDGSFSTAAPLEPFTFTATNGNKTFKLKNKNASGEEDEILTLKSGEKKTIEIIF